MQREQRRQDKEDSQVEQQRQEASEAEAMLSLSDKLTMTCDTRLAFILMGELVTALCADNLEVFEH